MLRWLPIFFVAAASFFLDQTSKFFVSRTIPLHASVPVWRDVFRLTHVLNPGAAFGLFAGRAASLHRPFFLALSVFAVGFILYLFQREPTASLWRRTAFGLILGGVIGNGYDRVRLLGVVDFLQFGATVSHHRYEFAIFNTADAVLCVGVAMLIAEMLHPRARARRRRARFEQK